MKKYLKIILLNLFLLGATAVPAYGQSLNDTQLDVVADVLLASGDYTPDQVVEIIIGLSGRVVNSPAPLAVTAPIASFTPIQTSNISTQNSSLQNTFVQNSSPVSLNDTQLDVVADVLLASGDYTPDQVVEIIIGLSGRVASDRLGDDSNGINQLCSLSYAGSDSLIAIQQELQNQGYTITKIDGINGPETRSAIQAFQIANNATTVDGNITPETRSLLAISSLNCSNVIGFNSTSEDNLCRIKYNGDTSLIAIQQELQNQGYTITKIDGINGPETRSAIQTFEIDNGVSNPDGIIDEQFRTALIKNSIDCDFEINTLDTVIDNPITVNETENNQPGNISTNQNTSSEIALGQEIQAIESLDFIIKDEIVAGVRTAGQTPDDTAVFTFRMTFNPDSNIFVSTNSDITFDVNIYNQQGQLVDAMQSKSIVSTANKILRADLQGYYVVAKGDTFSLRSTSQPGPGIYYAELGRLSYTRDNAQIILAPESSNYPIDKGNWRSGTISLLN